jgi:hypothetical protein
MSCIKIDYIILSLFINLIYKNMNKSKRIIMIATMFAISTFTVFYACRKSTNSISKETTKSSNINLDAASISSGSQIVIDSFSTLTANFVNSINNLNQENFCILNNILNSNVSDIEKQSQIYSNSGLEAVSSSAQLAKLYYDNNNLVELLQNEETKIAYTHLLGDKINFGIKSSDRQLAGGSSLDCKAYLAAWDACLFGLQSCLATSFLAGPEAWGPGAAICIIAYMYCCNSADGANPACAAYYSWGRALPNILDRKNLDNQNLCN